MFSSFFFFSGGDIFKLVEDQCQWSVLALSDLDLVLLGRGALLLSFHLGDLLDHCGGLGGLGGRLLLPGLWRRLGGGGGGVGRRLYRLGLGLRLGLGRGLGLGFGGGLLLLLRSGRLLSRSGGGRLLLVLRLLSLGLGLGLGLLGGGGSCGGGVVVDVLVSLAVVT